MNSIDRDQLIERLQKIRLDGFPQDSIGAMIFMGIGSIYNKRLMTETFNQFGATDQIFGMIADALLGSEVVKEVAQAHPISSYVDGTIWPPLPLHDTANYSDDLDKNGDVMTVEDFRESVRDGMFIDYDGFGHPVRDGKMDGSFMVRPSSVVSIPADATHIIWYNR